MTSRIALPELGRGDDDIGSIMAGAPASNFNLLKKLLLLGSTNTIACRVTDTDDDTDHISRFLIRLHHTCPNISEFRIHLDIDYRVNVECFAAEQFRGILQWQKLKKVVVEVSKCQQGPGQLSCASDEQVVRLREKIVMVLQAEMMRRGMRVSITAPGEEISCPRIKLLNLREEHGRWVRAQRIREEMM